MSRVTPPPVLLDRPADQPEFPYGWREVQRALPDGSVEFDRIPLTLEDVLHPQEGDVGQRRIARAAYLGQAFVDRGRRVMEPSRTGLAFCGMYGRNHLLRLIAANGQREDGVGLLRTAVPAPTEAQARE